MIGIIVLLVGGMALALGGRGGEGAALANAQTIVEGLVTSARAQAALNQTNARVIVYGNQPPSASADASKYLRTLQVVRQETVGTTSVWVAVGDPVTLPSPICVVPPSPVPANHLRTGVTWNNNVANGPVSTLTVQNSGFSYLGQSPTTGRGAAQYFGSPTNGRILYLELDPTGAVVSPSTSTFPTIKIAVTTAILGGNALPQFNNASGVRGLIIRRSGAISAVNDATSF